MTKGDGTERGEEGKGGERGEEGEEEEGKMLRTGQREKNIVNLPWVEGDHCCSQWIPLHLKTKLDLGFNDRYSQ